KSEGLCLWFYLGRPPYYALMAGQALTLPLLRGSITLDDALEQEEDVLLDVSYPDSRMNFFLFLYTHRNEIAAMVSDHLGLGQFIQCRLGEVREWIHGSFNVCIPVYVENWTNFPAKRVLIRFPLPYKIGESSYPGNADEKLRCEAATFIWIRQHCPDIPLPRLWGFGFAGGQTVCYQIYQTRTYAGHDQDDLVLEHGYLIMDYIDEPGIQMLSDTWNKFPHQPEKTANLYRDLSRIMLSLSQCPLPRIGSWTIDSNGVLQLSNRPLTLRLHQLENAGIPTNIGRDLTYPSTDSYYLDILSCHDSRIRHQPNSMYDEEDGRAQIANLSIMRTLLPHFTDRELRQGPFFYKLTDLHPSNIFVDSQWQIKYLVDLEWACSLPAESLRPPYWLTGRTADNILGEHLETFSKEHDQFTKVFEEEEMRLPPLFNSNSYRTNIMRNGWKIGNFWYFQALDSLKGLFNIFCDHIQPRFAASHSADPSEFSRIVSQYWAVDTEDVIVEKLKDKKMYEKELRLRFQNSSEDI
ncbi:uncharacterized protein N7459_009999, partial [Penicillium hispanicum]|uniref:uncharacterized protein n=1 Tax=Penicillium hispanicum TaxID=1080232 RepID=UPI002540CDE4